MMSDRPPNAHEKADAMMVSLLDAYKDFLSIKGVTGDMGSLLRAVLFTMHTQAIALQQRPDMVEPFIEQIEAFIIESGISRHDATYMRDAVAAACLRKWSAIENMDMTNVDDKQQA